LKKEGFTALNHIISKGMAYYDIKDFRHGSELAAKIICHDLEYVNKAHVLVVWAKNPCYGTAMEIFAASRSGKKVILFGKTQFLLRGQYIFSDYVVTSQQVLLRLLKEIKCNVRQSKSE
jgi:hypothetical protein